MFVKFIRNACLAAAVSVAAIGATAAPASANGFSVGVTIGNGPVDVDFRGRGHGRGHDRGYRARDNRGYGCDPRRAVRKASRIGMRHARVVRANSRAVAVAGRLNGDRSIIRFANRRSCPVAGIRSR